MSEVRGRDGDMYEVHNDEDGPVCVCDGTGFAGTQLIRTPSGRSKEVAIVCRACRPHLAGVPSVAARAAGSGFTRRRRLALVR